MIVGDVDELVLHDRVSVVYGAMPADISVNGDLLLEDQEGAVAIDVHDQNGNDVGSENLAGEWEVPILHTASTIKTGQVISYAPDDDGAFQAGRLVNNTTLEHNNAFGNTNRFTDELGGQDYLNNIVIDWSLQSQAGRAVCGIYRVQSANVTWSTAVSAAAALSIGTFTSGWRLPNVKELFHLFDFSLTNCLGYSPLNMTNLATNARPWTGTTVIGDTAYAWSCIISGWIEPRLKTNTRGWFAVRTFTLTELGL